MKKFRTPVLATLLSILASSAVLAAWQDGVSAFQAGRFEDAAAEFRAVVDASPDAPQGHYMLGLSLLRTGRPATAVESLVRAVELLPESAEYRIALAQTQLQAGEADDALDVLAALEPSSVDEARRASFGTLLATVATRSGRDAEALAVVEKALAADPGSKPLWLARSQLERRLNRPRESFDALVSAYELDRTDSALGQRAVQTAFAQAQASDQESDARHEWYARGAAVAAALADREPTALHLRYAGEARMGLQDYPAASSWFQRAAAADPAQALPHFYLASCALALEDAETALGHLATALERSPDAELATEIWNVRGSALRRLERFEQAADAYRRAGNDSKVAEMAGLLEKQKSNELWDAEKRRCEEKQRTVREHLAENDYLQGTAAWRELEKKAAEALADCQAYLGASE